MHYKTVFTMMLAITAAALMLDARGQDSSCIEVSDIEYSVDREASEINWEAVVLNDCGPEINLLLVLEIVDDEEEGTILYSSRTTEQITEPGRKLVTGDFFVPVFVMNNIEDINVSVGQVRRAY